MKNFDLGKKIKDLRTSKALSQEELAEKAGLSLRTIQRIENGETEARGDSLKRLAAALNVLPNDLVEIIEDEDKSILLTLNLSALTLIINPLFGIIAPLILWAVKKKKVKGVDEIGKRLINFQISWSLLTYVPVIVLACFHVIHIHFPVVFATMGMYGINIIIIIVNSIRVYNSRKVFYQPAIPFFR